jgi:uncharacterized membrane protein HdeD (DUF308 family)
VKTSSTRTMFRNFAGSWWVLLVTGILWFLIALIVLRFDLASLAAVGTLLGVVLMVASINEFFIASMRRGWRWAHVLLGVVFAIGGIWAFLRPIATFVELAAILGFLLVFKGTLDLVASAATKEEGELWWLGVVAGILEILLGFWASQQLFPARAELILLWVGFLAVFRGFSEVVVAFELRRASTKGR